MKPYPSYRDSGVEWLGEIPSHWKHTKVKHICSVKGRIGFRGYTTDDLVNEGEGALALGATQISASGNIDLSSPVFISWNKYYESPEIMVSKDDVLIVQRGSTCGKIGYVQEDIGHTTINPSLVLLRDHKVNSKYLFYSTTATAVKNQADILISKTAIPMLSQEQIGNFYLPLPSTDEQQAIIDFLDRKTTQIDKLIEKKQQQIDLLREMRDTLTQNAMRSSEAQSLKLGEVADWVKRPINRQDEELYERIGLYNRGRGIFHKPIAKGVDLGDSDFFEIKDGDFVISGQFAWEGAVALARQEEDGCFASHRYYSLTGKPDYAETAYLFSFFTTQLGDNLLNHHSRGAAGRNRPLNINTLLREKIPVPPLSMQKPITDLIEKEVVLKKNTQKLVNLLQEYRTALVSEVVAGKIDVREQ